MSTSPVSRCRASMWKTSRPEAEVPSSRIIPVRSSLTLPARSSARPSSGREVAASGMRPSTTFTAPPMAPLPYSRLAGPFSTSIWLARKGSMLTAWSTLTVDTSPAARPSLSTCTRAPSRPRMTGRPTPAPKNDDWTPGRRETVSPMELALASSRRSPASTATGRARSSAVRAMGLARTVRASRSVTWWSWPAGGRSSSWARAGREVARATRMAPVSRAGRARWRGALCEGWVIAGLMA